MGMARSGELPLHEDYSATVESRIYKGFLVFSCASFYQENMALKENKMAEKIWQKNAILVLPGVKHHDVMLACQISQTHANVSSTHE